MYTFQSFHICNLLHVRWLLNLYIITPLIGTVTINLYDLVEFFASNKFYLIPIHNSCYIEV